MGCPTTEEETRQALLHGVSFTVPTPTYASKKWFDMHPKEKVQLPLVQKNDLMDLTLYAIDLTNLKHANSPTNGSGGGANGNTPYSPTWPP